MPRAKVLLVCPSNLLYMPYFNNYADILNKNGILYQVVGWNRFGLNEPFGEWYLDNKRCHRRGFFDYYMFSKFVTDLVNRSEFDRIIVFGLQLTFFLKRILLERFDKKFILDIRDRNSIISFLGISRVVDGSAFTVLSSPGYVAWMPKNKKYFFNHNTVVDTIQFSPNDLFSKKQLRISCIGALRDLKANLDLINSLALSERISLRFHGEGDINTDISTFIKLNGIANVVLTGRYERSAEAGLYLDSDFVNIIRYADSANNKTALPNRLYQSVYYGIPVLAISGTFVSNLVQKYNLGLVLDNFSNVEFEIRNYIDKFDKNLFDQGRKCFLDEVVNDNLLFRKKLLSFFID